MYKNLEEPIKRLMKAEGIKTQKDLLRRLYQIYFKKTGAEIEAWVKSTESNFSSMKKGQRDFPLEFRYALSELSGLSFSEFCKAKKDKKEDDIPFGIRYAVYKDQEKYYKKLLESMNEDGDRWIDGYEYDKNIFDYVIERKAVTGLRFLLEETSVWWDYSGNEKLLLWLIELDDPKLFLKVWGEENLFNYSFDHEENGEIFLEKIIGTKEIFEALCRECIHPESKLKYMPRLLFDILKFSLNRNKQVIAQRIISAYAKFIDDQTKAFQNDTNQESNNKLMANLSGSSPQSEIRYDKKTVMYVWDVSKLPDERGGFEEQIAYYQISNIINRLKTKDLAAMEYGDSFVKDGIHYVKKESDVGLEALKYLTEERGCKFLPTYIGEESGVTKISAYKSDWHGVEFSELGEILGEIHLLSQEKLGADRVYMYSRGFSNGFGRMLVGGTKVITNWKTCDIGTPMLDIVTAFLNYKNARGYFGKVYRRFIEEKDESYQELSQFLNAYPDKKIIENFGDKFNEELDRMLKNEIQGAQGKNTEAIEKLYMAKSFAEIYRNDLNLITRQGCKVEGDK